MADADAREEGDDAVSKKGFSFEGAYTEKAPVSNVRGAKEESGAGEPKPTIRLTLKVTDPVYERLSMFCVRRRTNKQAVLTDALLRYLDDETG